MRGNRLFKVLDFYVGIALLRLLSWFGRGRKGVPLGDISPRRILVIKFVALGDAVLLVPSLRALRKRFPRAEIIFLGTGLTESFLSQFPEYIDQFVTVRIEQLLRRPSHLFHTLKRIRTLRCDVAVDFEQWSRLSALFAALSGAAVRLGFRTKGQHRHAAFTHRVERDRSKHEVDNFLGLARLLTKAEEARELEIKVDDASLVRAQSYLSKNGWRRETPLLVVHPGCGSHGYPREWAPHHYSALLEKLMAERKLFVVVTGTLSETRAMNGVRLAGGARPPTFLINDQDDFVALLSMASLVISGNNGAMHLAAALQLPQIALHGPTNANQWGPLNANAVIVRSKCSGCPCLDLGFEYHRRDGYCMEQIDAEEVYQDAQRILAQA